MPAPRPVINGTKGAWLQPQEIGVDDSGSFSSFTWQGTTAEIEATRAQLVGTGCTFIHRKSPSGGADTLEARFSFIPGQPDEEVPVNDWELFAQVSEKDILESDLAIIGTLTQREKEVIRNAIQSPPESASPALTPNSNAESIYKLMLNGVRSVIVQTPTLRHTMTVSNQWTVKASLANVGSIYTSATLALQEGTYNMLLDLPAPDPNRTDISVKYGWLKYFPTIRVAPRFKIQMAQEWRFGLWATLIYGNPI